MIAIINADLRTCGAKGDIRDGALLVQDGKFVAVGAGWPSLPTRR